MNAIYEKGRQKFLEGSIAWLTDNIKCVLIDATDYTVNLGSHEFLSDVPALGRVATSANLSSKTSVGGVADAADILIAAVTGDGIDAVIVYKDSGVAATSPLIAYLDTGMGFPFTPTGSDITVGWNVGSNKIFKL